MKQKLKLIAGLGNPGIKYARTRHNVGFMALDTIAKDLGVKFSSHKKTGCEVAKSDKLILAKPQKFMNNSGGALAKLVSYFKVEPADVLVVYDDVDLPIGAVRFREEGSSAGHKGVRSIIDAFGTNKFKRIRIGIGKNDKIETDKYVLQEIPKVDITKIKTVVDEAAKLAVDKV